jgi:hypothetical protein
VVVELEADEEPRTVEPPADLAAALAGDPAAGDAFAALSYTHQGEYAEWVADANGIQSRTYSCLLYQLLSAGALRPDDLDRHASLPGVGHHVGGAA